MVLAKEVYLATTAFPASEKFGLVSQMNRAVISIPSNIAEGAGRNSDKELAQFLSIAVGSAFELETQMILAQELKFISKENADTILPRISKIQKMLFALKKSLMEKQSFKKS